MLYRHVFVGLLFGLIANTVLTPRVEAGIVNGDFETGDLTGWENFTAGAGSNSSVQLIDGSHRLVMESKGGGNALVDQSFSVQNGLLLSFDYSGEFASQGDIGYEISITENGHRRAIATHVYKAAESAIIPTTHVIFSIPGNAGDILSFFIARDVSDHLSTGRLVIDNVQLVPVPEPSTWLMAAVGALFVGLVSRLKRRP